MNKLDEHYLLPQNSERTDLLEAYNTTSNKPNPNKNLNDATILMKKPRKIYFDSADYYIQKDLDNQKNKRDQIIKEINTPKEANKIVFDSADYYMEKEKERQKKIK